MLKKVVQLIKAGVFVALMVAASAYAEEKGYQETNAQDLKKMMDSDEVLVIFPLSPIEFNNQHIKDSVNIPIDQLEEKLPKDKSQKLVFYCLGTSCVASWRAAEKAVGFGYRNVYAFREGLPGWIAAGYSTVTLEELPKVDLVKITTSELSSKLANEPIVLLDINLDEDAHKFYIDTAKRMHIPLDELHLRLSDLDKTQQIVVLCLKGNRAPIAARYLIGKGYKNVVVVDGGLQQWVLEGRPVKEGS